MARTRKQTTKTSNGDIYLEYHSIYELSRALETTPAGNFSRTYDRPEFCPFTFDATSRALMHGWHEGTREIHALKAAISTTEDLSLGGHDVAYDVTGDWIDMGAYMDGTPECMGSITPQHVIKDTVTIVVNATAHAGISELSIRIRGAAITALIERLQDEYEVNLIVGISNDTWKGRMEVAWYIDLSDEFSRDVVAFAVAHPGFLRRAFFALLEQARNTDNCHEYGTVKDLTETLSKLKGTKHYYFGPNHGESEWTSPDRAAAKVIEIMYEIQND